MGKNVIKKIICPNCNSEETLGTSICSKCSFDLSKLSMDSLVVSESELKDEPTVNIAESESTTTNKTSSDSKADTPKKSFRKPLLIGGISLLSLVLVAAIYFFIFSPTTVTWFCLHKKVDATCVKSEYCERCGETWGNALGHKYSNATCTTPKTCSVCNSTSGSPLGHDWIPATCNSPKTCSVCNETEGSNLSHVWIEATCVHPRTCELCGTTSGTALDHNWADATCELPIHCTRCDAVSGSALGHNYVDHICTVCNENNITAYNITEVIEIPVDAFQISSSGEVVLINSFINRSTTRTIASIEIVQRFNDTYGNEWPDENGRSFVRMLYSEAPLAPGQGTGELECNTGYYNSSFVGNYSFVSMTITYTDGTVLEIDGSIAREAITA